jgi:hypothetical protein
LSKKAKADKLFLVYLFKLLIPFGQVILLVASFPSTYKNEEIEANLLTKRLLWLLTFIERDKQFI